MAFALGLFMGFIQPGVLYTDGGIFSAIALKDLQGGTLYLNAWENKPPGLFYLIELFYLIIPNHVYALYALAISVFLVTAACQFYILYRQTETFGLSLIIAIIASYFTVYKNNIAEGLVTEIYGSACIIVGIAAYTHYMHHKQFRMLLLGACSVGASFWFKEPFLLLYIAAMIMFLLQLKQGHERIKLIASSLIPSVICLILLSMSTDKNGQHALHGFIESIQYNLSYVQSDQIIALKTKINDLYEHLLTYAVGLLFIMIYMSYKLLFQKQLYGTVISAWFILFASAFIFISSPYNFGHYYYPFFALFYVVFALLYGAFNQQYKNALMFTVVVLGLIQMFNIDKQPIKLNYDLQPYQEDNIVKTLKKHPNKTLFIDYVDKGGYYVKSGLSYPTFLPVALQVHFNESAQGLQNRTRIWKELSEHKPDFLITTHTTSYFSWFLPDPDFYKSNYTKIDSVIKADDNPVFLWQLK